MTSDNEPDYSVVGNDELNAILSRVDKEKFPQRFEAIQAELSRRTVYGITDPTPQNIFASLSSRSLAISVDGILLGIITLIPLGFAKMAGDFFGLNLIIQFFGIVISFFYFGHFESINSEKSTFGKRLFGIQLVNADGNKLSFFKAGLRATVYSLIGFGFGLLTSLFTAIFPPTVNSSKPFVLFVLGLGNLWQAIAITDLLFLFWSPQKQRLLDVIFQTFVINKKYMQTALTFSKLSSKKIVIWTFITLVIWFLFFYAFSTSLRA